MTIKIKKISPYSHGSLKTERHIRGISELTAEQPPGTGQMWTHYLQTCTYACNSFASPTLDQLGPFQLMFGRFPKVLIELETNCQEGRTGHSKHFMSYSEKDLHTTRR